MIFATCISPHKLQHIDIAIINKHTQYYTSDYGFFPLLIVFLLFMFMDWYMVHGINLSFCILKFGICNMNHVNN